MERLEQVISLIKYVKSIDMQKFTYDELILGMNNMNLEYTEIRGADSILIIPKFDENIRLNITRKSHFMITKFEIIHILLNDLQAYYDELVIENVITEGDIKIAKHKIELFEARGVRTWEDKQVLIQSVLKKYHNDELVATLMFLKHANASNKQISYIERHFTPIKYDDKETNMFIELYNKQYKCFATIDLINCQVIEDKFEMILNVYNSLISPSIA